MKLKEKLHHVKIASKIIANYLSCFIPIVGEVKLYRSLRNLGESRKSSAVWSVLCGGLPKTVGLIALWNPYNRATSIDKIIWPVLYGVSSLAEGYADYSTHYWYKSPFEK